MIKYKRALIKLYCLEYDIYVDILDIVIKKICSYVEGTPSILEAGGMLIGYKIKNNNTVVIEDITEPDKNDVRQRFFFIRKSLHHMDTVLKKNENKSFCIGNWHTHPFSNDPLPSTTDINTWRYELKHCKSTFGYQVFIISGQTGFKAWIGEEKQETLYELYECVLIDGLYVK